MKFKKRAAAFSSLNRNRGRGGGGIGGEAGILKREGHDINETSAHGYYVYIWPIISINPIEINSCTNKNQKR
jgi:hypothetical protein